VTRAVSIAAAALVVVALAGCGGGGAKQTTTAAPVASTVKVYFLENGKVKPISRKTSDAAPAYLAAFRELIKGFGVGEYLELTSSVHVVGGGYTLRRSSDGLITLTTASPQPREALAQIVFTLTPYSAGRAVVVNGTRYTRADFETETPAILVESPLPHQTTPSPLRITGTANTFEATFQYELLDAVGKVIATHFVTATAGSGTRGTYDVTVPYPAGHGGPGTLVVYENSAADGSRINVSKIALRFTG
jgi:hypothetical protein